jgi:alkanesulfonate monooxygenase SsuD/methylene tetrahydromethanopterin reductase-like flavin-dependent oxidoreductase (luciferase family)
MSGTGQVRFGLGVPNGGDFADPVRLATLAHEAEVAGWDGFFLWDHVIRRPPWQPMVDPWVTLAAVATATERIVLGPMVTPLARRRVSVVARQSVTLDRLSGGRLRLGVGLGAPDDEFTRFGEDADARTAGPQARRVARRTRAAVVGGDGRVPRRTRRRRRCPVRADTGG